MFIVPKPPPRVYKHSTLPAANPASYAVICPFLRRHMGVLTRCERRLAHHVAVPPPRPSLATLRAAFRYPRLSLIRASTISTRFDFSPTKLKNDGATFRNGTADLLEALASNLFHLHLHEERFRRVAVRILLRCNCSLYLAVICWCEDDCQVRVRELCFVKRRSADYSKHRF